MKKKYTSPSFEIVELNDEDCILTSCGTVVCEGTYNADEGDNTYTLNCNWGLNC